MKKAILITLVGMIYILFGISGRLFMVIPQAIGLKQLVFIFVTIAAFTSLLFLYQYKKSRYALLLFFFFYPFLSQTANYFNISSAFFIITPALLFLLLQVFLSKGHRPSKGLFIVYLFCASTLVSVFVAPNKYTAGAFWILGVGSFAIIIYLIYELIIQSQDPWEQIQKLLCAIVLGSFLYFLLEIVIFKISPSDIIHIYTRRWDLLPVGRFYTAGFREPAGMGFVYSILFFPALHFAQQSRIYGHTRRNWTVLVLVTFLFLLSGTRAAIISIADMFIAIMIIQKILKVDLIRINMKVLVILIACAVIGAGILLSRPFGTSQAASSSPADMATISIGGRSFTFLGTAAQYYNQTATSLSAFAKFPLGTGPLSAPIPPGTTDGSVSFYFSALSNLFVIGATFGWVSLLLWIGFLFYLFTTFYHLRIHKDENDPQSHLLGLGILFLVILLASHLPGSVFIGPNLNWGNFNYYTPITPQTAAVPADYPALISGLVIGVIIGIMRTLHIPLKRN